MKKQLLGTSPRTSIMGYALAALIIIQELVNTGEKSILKITVAVAIGVLGRLVKDSDGVNRNETKNPE